MILACNVVWNEVNDNFQAVFVSSFDQFLKFFHSVGNGSGEVWVNIIIILDCIWGTCFAFDYIWVVLAYSELAVVGLCCVFDNAGVPDMGGT